MSQLYPAKITRDVEIEVDEICLDPGEVLVVWLGEVGSVRSWIELRVTADGRNQISILGDAEVTRQ